MSQENARGPKWIFPAVPMTIENILEWSAEGLTSEELYYIDEVLAPRLEANLENAMMHNNRKEVPKKDGPIRIHPEMFAPSQERFGAPVTPINYGNNQESELRITGDHGIGV